MEYENWLTSLAHTSRVMHAVLSDARNRVERRMEGSEVRVGGEARLVAKLNEAISSLSSVFICADIAADEYWCLAQTGED